MEYILPPDLRSQIRQEGITIGQEKGGRPASSRNQILGTIVYSCVSKIQHNDRQRRVRSIAINAVRIGSKADVTLLNFDVRFTPKSGHELTHFMEHAS